MNYRVILYTITIGKTKRRKGRRKGDRKYDRKG